MAKAKQAKTTTPVVENTTPASETAVKPAKTVKAAKAVKAETAPAPVVDASVETPLVDASAPASDEFEASVEEQSIEFLAKLQQMSSLISSLKTEFRSLEKKWSRELKSVKKLSSRRKRKAGNRAPSGFVKPTRISDELASFLGKEKGSEMARTAVTRDINAYIRTHNLQDTNNGRKINPDAKLASLLKLGAEDELTYFNLQRFMSPHFAKTVKAESVATA
uniref:DM2 domain-containing protein n=1 Tax=viral metagenome TaxID=1070528 RepID=A0A6C0LD65_9ZZZZ